METCTELRCCQNPGGGLPCLRGKLLKHRGQVNALLISLWGGKGWGEDKTGEDDEGPVETKGEEEGSALVEAGSARGKEPVGDGANPEEEEVLTWRSLGVPSGAERSSRRDGMALTGVDSRG